MIRRITRFTCSLVLLQLYCAVSPMEECFDPATTVQYVQFCPQNLQAWNSAAERKNCSVYQPTCQNQEKPVYHCVTNPWMNATLEVCASEQSIVGYYCPEFNLEGGIIQENYQVSCKEAPVACPFYYYSTEAYRYPSCFRINDGEKRETTTDGMTTHNPIKSNKGLQKIRKFKSKDVSMIAHSVPSHKWEITGVFSNERNESIPVTLKPTENTNNRLQVPGTLPAIIAVLCLLTVAFFVFLWYLKRRRIKILKMNRCNEMYWKVPQN